MSFSSLFNSYLYILIYVLGLLNVSCHWLRTPTNPIIETRKNEPIKSLIMSDLPNRRLSRPKDRWKVKITEP